MSIDNARARNWCFTLNNYTPEEYSIIEDLSTKASYLIIGKEVSTSGTPHLQCYIEYPNAVRGTALKKIIERWDEEKQKSVGAIHWEVRKGTAKQASEYCNKEKNFVEFGSLSAQGKRTDLEEVGAAVLNGTSFQEIASTFPGTYIKYHKGITALRDAAKGLLDLGPRDPNKPPRVIWRWGLAGVGKSRYVYDNHRTVFLQKGTKWWDGYQQQEAIIIDDFDGKWGYRDLLKVLDRYPLRVEIKGGTIELNSPYIYITCEHPPTWYWGLMAMYRNNDDSPASANELEQVMRRIEQGGGAVIHVEAPVPKSNGTSEEIKTG